MQKLLLTLSILLCGLGANAIDNIGRIKLAERQIASRQASHIHPFSADSEEKEQTIYTSMIIEIDDDSAIADLEGLGVIIANRRADMLLTFVPNANLSELENIHHVTGCSTGRTALPHLDKAVKATGVDEALSGSRFGQAFTGKGVVVGFSDLGFDPGHAAFAGRVKAIYHTVDTTATTHQAESPSEIAVWTSDNEDNYHASHVAGILAGADASSPYQGVARGADIVGCTSTLDDVCILIGVEKIIAHAKAASQPAVINLSLGSTLGPRDGTDAFCRYLDLCADDASILLAAGNDGGKKIYASKQLTADDNIMSCMLESYNWGDTKQLQGYFDFWSDKPSPLKIRFRMWDRLVNDIIWESDWFDTSDGELITVSPADNPVFADNYSGVILAAGELADNNRYNVTVGVNARSIISYPEKTWSQTSLVIDLQGAPDAFIEGRSDGSNGFFAANSAYRWISPGIPGQSISTMACGFKTICVGSATTRDSAPTVGGEPNSWAGFVDEGTVSNFSSYGTTFDGRSLPHFCAPGAYIISAFNRYALAKYPSMTGSMAAESPANPGHYYFAECGTSMATPHAAGIFALWLEADPSLSPEELRDIAVSTARYDGVSSDNPRSGAGMIDAVAGLEHILRKAGINGPISDSLIEVWRNGSSLGISGCTAEEASVEIFNLSGQKIFSGNPCDAVLPSSPLIVRVTTDRTSVTRKLL